MTEIDFRPALPSVPPVFLLSTPRAGSTLLRYILDAHPRVCSPGELLLGSLCHRLLVSLERTVGLVASSGEAPEAVAAREARRIVSGMMQTYARARGKEIWCDKSPANVDELPVLLEVFPDARFVCLHRHCLDVVHSSLEVSRNGFMDELAEFVGRSPKNLVDALVESWLDRTGKILDLEERLPGRCHRVLYESVVLRPDETLPRLFRFLGVDWDQNLLERAFSMRHDEGGGDPKVRFTRALDPDSIGKGSGVHLELISDPQRERMNLLLARLGYQAVSPDWNRQPSPSRPAGTPAPRQGVATVGDLFSRHIPDALERNSGRLAAVGASFKFVVSGREQGTWTVDLTGSRPRVLAADRGDRAADCTIVTDADVLLAIANKTLNPVSAFQEGKVRVQGRMELVYDVPLFL